MTRARVDILKTPKSMQADLQAWNNGTGIDLESWVGCEGNFALAVGYASIFNPQFCTFEDYIFAYEEKKLKPNTLGNMFVAGNQDVQNLPLSG